MKLVAKLAMVAWAVTAALLAANLAMAADANDRLFPDEPAPAPSTAPAATAPAAAPTFASQPPAPPTPAEPAGSAPGAVAPVAAMPTAAPASTVQPAEPSTAEVDPVRLLSQPKQEWYSRIKVTAAKIANLPTEQYLEAEKEITSITDPNALEAMGQVLYTPHTRWRGTLVKALQNYAHSGQSPANVQAVMYLSDIAVADDSPILRGKARGELLKADTPRYTGRLKYQLDNNPSSTVRTRAAELLTDLKDTSAAAGMINILTTEEYRMKGAEVTSLGVILDIRTANALPATFTPVTVQAVAASLAVASATLMLPRQRCTQINTTVMVPGGMRIEPDWEKVTIKHPGVLLALQDLTGQNFGYDREAWLRWLNSQRDENPIRSSEPTVDWSK